MTHEDQKSIEMLESRTIELAQTIRNQNEILNKLINITKELNIDTYVSEKYAGKVIPDEHALYFGTFSSATCFRYLRHTPDCNGVIQDVFELELQDRAFAYHAIDAFIEKVISEINAEVSLAVYAIHPEEGDGEEVDGPEPDLRGLPEALPEHYSPNDFPEHEQL